MKYAFAAAALLAVVSADWTDNKPKDPVAISSTTTEAKTWEDATKTPVVHKTTTTASASETWYDYEPADSTKTVTGTKTETIWEDAPTSTPVKPVVNTNTWEDASKPSSKPVSPVSDDKGCVLSVVTVYGKPTWVPTPAVPTSSEPATWIEVPAPSTPVVDTKTTTPAPVTWVDVSSTTKPVVPTSTDPVTWADCGASTTTVTKDVTVTVTAEWEDVTANPVEGGEEGKPTWTKPSKPTTTKSEEDPEETWADHDAPKTPVEQKTTTTAKHTWSKPSKPTTTTTSADPTWADHEEPAKPTTTTTKKPVDGDHGHGKPTTTKPADPPAASQTYWGDEA